MLNATLKGPLSDEVMAEAAQVLLDGLGDADFVAKVKEKTGKDLRDMSQEQVEQLMKDRDWYKWGPRRN